MFSLLSFLKGNTAFYIALGLAFLVILGLWLRLDAQNARLDKAKSDLNISLEANNRLYLSIETLKIEHQKQMEAVKGASEAREQIKERVEYVNRYIYKEYEKGENNLTRLFNAMVYRLWNEQNATCEGCGAGKGANS